MLFFLDAVGETSNNINRDPGSFLLHLLKKKYFIETAIHLMIFCLVPLEARSIMAAADYGGVTDCVIMRLVGIKLDISI